jgi:PAS domain S-box-containing protein
MIDPEETRVLVIAPVGQDGKAMATLLRDQGIPAEVFAAPRECLEAMASGAGALLLTEEALEMPGADELLAHLQSQPAWSELPVVILTSGGESRLVRLLDLAASAAGSVTLLERPMSPATLLRSMQVAWHSRQRQYQVRSMMAEQERQQRHVRESEEKYRTLFDSIDEGFCIIEVLFGADGRAHDYRFLEVNGAFARHTGLPAGAVGKTIRELVPRQDAHWFETYGRIALTGKPERFEARGEAMGRFYDVYAFRLGAAEKRRVSVLFRDVTERKTAEEAVQRSRDTLELLSRTVSTLLMTPDPQSVIEGLCNEVREFLDCAVFFNFLLDPGTRRLRFNACGGVDPRVARKVEGLELGQSLCGTAARDGCRVLEQSLSASDDPRSALVRSLGIRAYACHPLVGVDNQVLGTLSFGTRTRDAFSPEDLELMKAVTHHVAVAMLRRQSEEALRASEERFRALTTASSDVVYRMNADWSQMFHLRGKEFIPDTESASSGWMEKYIHPEDQTHVTRVIKEAVRTKSIFAMEHRVRRADGTFAWTFSRAVPLLDGQGEIVEWFGAASDITERRQAEDVLARDKQELERLVAERTAKLQELVGELEHFSYSITHDMRAPLRAMMAFAQVLEEMVADAANQEQQDFVRRIGLAARRMDLLITDALSYSKAVRSELPLEPVDVGRLLRGMVDTYPELQSARRGISVDRDLPLVMANEAGLTQCFSNLLANAVKFVKPGDTPEIQVRAEQFDGWVRLWVEDRGVGISKAMLPRVFDMFSRGASAQAGTGIGLALVRKVVSRMGGRVGVESEEGEGSRFWVELKPGDVRQSRAGEAALRSA